MVGKPGISIPMGFLNQDTKDLRVEYIEILGNAVIQALFLN